MTIRRLTALLLLTVALLRAAPAAPEFLPADAIDVRTLLTFNQHLDGAIRQFEHLQDGRDTAHLKHIGH